LISAAKASPGTSLHDVEEEFDSVMKGEMGVSTTKIIQNCIPSGLQKVFPKNLLQAMVLSGAKGGIVNQTQITALLGQ
jgi:DNA-directed RNA polymerase I subunit RPA1